MPETEIDFAPSPIGSARRRLPPFIAGATILAFLGLALAKPWGGPPQPGTTATPGTSLSGIAIAQPSVRPAAPTPTPTPRSTIVVSGTQPPAGAWGVGLGVAATSDPSSPAADWLVWTPVDPVSERPEPPIRDPLPMDTDCDSVPTLAALAPSIVGITVPASTSTDFSILGWWTNGPAPEALDGLLARLDYPGLDRVAELARVDGLPWPDGRYEFHVLTPTHVTALGFCIDSASAARSAPKIDPALETDVVHRLAPRAGAWGVGTGGSGPRLVRDDSWVDWVSVDPASSGPGSDVAMWPGTGVCDGTPALYGNAALVAVTVPPGLVPDWRVVTWWTNGVQVERFDRLVRQVSPPGNRGITYLERVDGGTWPDGRYEFHVLAGDHEVSLTVCMRTP